MEFAKSDHCRTEQDLIDRMAMGEVPDWYYEQRAVQLDRLPLYRIVETVSELAISDGDFSSASFDQLAEEVMELHLAIRRRHEHTPAMEWLEIATIAINALSCQSPEDVRLAYQGWLAAHMAEAIA